MINIQAKLSLSLKPVGFTKEEEDKLFLACEHLVKAINSDEFRQFILTHNYEEITYSGPFWNRNKTSTFIHGFKDCSLSNTEIYSKIMSGSEVLSPEADKEMDIVLEIDRRYKKSVLGYTYANTPIQWIYDTFFSSASIFQVAGNEGHEFMHKLGFGHSFKNTPYRNKSVPYAVGYFIQSFRG